MHQRNDIYLLLFITILFGNIIYPMFLEDDEVQNLLYEIPSSPHNQQVLIDPVSNENFKYPNAQKTFKKLRKRHSKISKLLNECNQLISKLPQETQTAIIKELTELNSVFNMQPQLQENFVPQILNYHCDHCNCNYEDPRSHIMNKHSTVIAQGTYTICYYGACLKQHRIPLSQEEYSKHLQCHLQEIDKLQNATIAQSNKAYNAQQSENSLASKTNSVFASKEKNISESANALVMNAPVNSNDLILNESNSDQIIQYQCKGCSVFKTNDLNVYMEHANTHALPSGNDRLLNFFNPSGRTFYKTQVISCAHCRKEMSNYFEHYQTHFVKESDTICCNICNTIIVSSKTLQHLILQSKQSHIAHHLTSDLMNLSLISNKRKFENVSNQPQSSANNQTPSYIDQFLNFNDVNTEQNPTTINNENKNNESKSSQAATISPEMNLQRKNQKVSQPDKETAKKFKFHNQTIDLKSLNTRELPNKIWWAMNAAKKNEKNIKLDNHE